jgi:hypothetical protein
MKASWKTLASVDRPQFAALQSRFSSLPVDLCCGLLYVDVVAQRLHWLRERADAVQFPVSTSRFGVGCREGSNRTPLGLHRVEEKIGAGAAPGTVFVGRQACARPPADGDDVISTRILWLSGLEPGRNSGPGCDSHDRYIYIHGTPHTGLLGTPASIGCIRMSDDDVVQLFENVVPGTPVVIDADK